MKVSIGLFLVVRLSEKGWSIETRNPPSQLSSAVARHGIVLGHRYGSLTLSMCNIILKPMGFSEYYDESILNQLSIDPSSLQGWEQKKTDRGP